MGAPPNNYSHFLESPYANHLSQYPSQNEGFVPNEFGGKIRVSSSTPSKHQYQQNSNYQQNCNNWRRGNNRYYNVNRGPPNGGGGYRNNYQNNYYQQQTNRNSNSGNRQQPYHGQKFDQLEGSARQDYYHPSMTVDPWKDLVDRHNAIKNSQINVVPTEDQETSNKVTLTRETSKT